MRIGRANPLIEFHRFTANSREGLAHWWLTNEQSQGDCVLQPKVAELARLPWVIIRKRIQPQRGCGHPVSFDAYDVGHDPVGVEIMHEQPSVIQRGEEELLM